jgi:hypothetical protein
MKEILVAALRRELDGYIRRGRTVRARQVVDQLVLLGCDVSEYLHSLASSVSPEEDSPKPKKPAARKATRGNN